MATHSRFTIFSDENQSQQSQKVVMNKRAALSVLTTANQVNTIAERIASTKSLWSNPKFDKENCSKPLQQLKVRPVNDKENQVVRPPKEDIVPKKSVEDARVPLKVIDEIMFSPASIGSPMVVSPMPVRESSPETSVPIKGEPFDDEFFTKQYGDSHFDFMKEQEIKLKARSDYMSRQRDISSSMRSVLVDWLVEVNDEYEMSDEVLFLAVSMLDRFLSVMSVVRSKLQLVGTAAMLVAAKVEEIYPPELSQFVYVTDDTYTASQIIRMEALLLNTLGFAVGSVHSLAFTRRLAIKAQTSRQIAHMAQYICELSLITDASLSYLPSEIGTAALILAFHNVEGKLDSWTSELQEFADIMPIRLNHAVDFLHKLLMNASSSQHRATYDKYSHSRYSSVSMLPLKTEKPQLS